MFFFNFDSPPALICSALLVKLARFRIIIKMEVFILDLVAFKALGVATPLELDEGREG